MLFIWILILLIGIAVLVKSADYFIEGAEKLGARFNINPFVIGVFVLGLGTSLPELTIGILSALNGTTEIISGNVVGSNIANLLFVLGIAAVVVKKANVNYDFLKFDIPLFITSAFLGLIALWNGVFTPFEGAFFLGIFFSYLLYNLRNHRKKLIPEEVKRAKPSVNKYTIIKIITSPFIMYFASKYIVESVINISGFLYIGPEIVAASVVALSTSLPELAVSFNTIKKGKIDEMIGNVLGSNIFNILIVLSIPSFISSIMVPSSVISGALPLMLIATIVALIIMRDKKITRWEGFTLLAIYGIFLLELFSLI